MNFDEIDKSIISMDKFTLNWRFVDERYGFIPNDHLSELKPLDEAASKFLDTFLSTTHLHLQFPFKTDFFQTIYRARIQTGNEREIKKWLYHRALPFDKLVYLSWDKRTSMKTK